MYRVPTGSKNTGYSGEANQLIMAGPRACGDTVAEIQPMIEELVGQQLWLIFLVDDRAGQVWLNYGQQYTVILVRVNKKHTEERMYDTQ